MPSTPLTCCSIGAAIVSAHDLGIGAGIAAVTCTVGGVIGGYMSIGSMNTATPPTRMMTSDSTQAKIGRSMKKRANTTGVLSHLSIGLGRLTCVDRSTPRRRRFKTGVGTIAGDESGGTGIDKLRLHNNPRPHALQTIDDHPLTRLQTVRYDLEPFLLLSHGDLATDNLVLVVDDEDIFQRLIFGQARGLTSSALYGAPMATRTRTNMPGVRARSPTGGLGSVESRGPEVCRWTDRHDCS